MQIDLITCLSGISIAIYTFTCLVCGLQLCLGIFSQGRHSNTYLSRILGICMLVMTGSAVCYLLANLRPEFDWLYRIGTSIDIFVFTGYTIMGYALYTNNESPKAKIIALASPLVVCAVLTLCFPERLAALFFVAAAILFAYYIYFGIALQRRERLLKDIYSDPESHSLRWIWTTIGLFVGWWAVSGLFQLHPFLLPWYNTAAFAYMTVLFLFVFAKVSNHKEPVSLETLQEIENHNDNHNDNDNRFTDSPAPQLTGEHNVARLSELMEQEQLYLNPDLTVEDVVKRLGTNTKYFSALLHDEMHTTFSQFVNEYRIERAKDLLKHTNTKVEYIGESCGFNSRQSFHRVFVKTTGQTPAEWREK